MRLGDLTLGGVLLVLAAALAGFSTTFPAIPGQRYGAELFPLLVALGFAGCGLALVRQGVRRARLAARGAAEPEPLVARTDWTHEPRAIPAVLLTIALMVAYILFSQRLGFMPMMAGMLLVLFRLLRVPWGQSLGFALGGTLLLDLLFRSLLLVPLPFGILPYLPW